MASSGQRPTVDPEAAFRSIATSSPGPATTLPTRGLLPREFRSQTHSPRRGSAITVRKPVDEITIGPGAYSGNGPRHQSGEGPAPGGDINGQGKPPGRRRDRHPSPKARKAASAGKRRRRTPRVRRRQTSGPRRSSPSPTQTRRRRPRQRTIRTTPPPALADSTTTGRTQESGSVARPTTGSGPRRSTTAYRAIWQGADNPSLATPRYAMPKCPVQSPRRMQGRPHPSF